MEPTAIDTNETTRPAGYTTRQFLEILEERGIGATPQVLFYMAEKCPHLPQPVVVGKTAGWPLDGLDAWERALAVEGHLTPAGRVDKFFGLPAGTATQALKDQRRYHAQWPVLWTIHPPLPGSPGYIEIRPAGIAELDRRGTLTQIPGARAPVE